MSTKYIGTFTLDDESLQIEFSSNESDLDTLRIEALNALVAADSSKENVVIAIGQLADFSCEKVNQ